MMKKIAYKDIFRRDGDGKITAYGKEYASIKEVPDNVLDVMELDLIKESKESFKIAKPVKVIEKIGWAFVYVSAAAAIASWCADGQAQEIFQSINMGTLFASAPEFATSTICRLAHIKKMKTIEKIYDEIEDEERKRQWERLEMMMGEDDSSDDIIYSDDFQEI